jgi:hypothetical protein
VFDGRPEGPVARALAVAAQGLSARLGHTP